MDFKQQPDPARSSRRQRNLATLGILLILVLLIYGIALVRMKQSW